MFSVLFREAAASAVPVLLDAGLAGVDSEAAQLGPFSQAALELSEAGEEGEPDHVVPQPDRLLVAGQPADDRPEKCGSAGRPEVDDRGVGQRVQRYPSTTSPDAPASSVQYASRLNDIGSDQAVMS